MTKERKNLSAQELSTLAGRRLSRDERRQWRDKIDAHERWGMRSTSQQTTAPNPFRDALAQYSPTSMNPHERRRYESLKAKADARDIELAAQNDAQLTRLRMLEDTDVQNATQHFTEVLETFETDSPELLSKKAQATGLLQNALNGDKSALSRYYAMANSLMDEHIERSEQELREVQTRASDARLAEAAREAAHARMEAIQSKAHANLHNLPGDRTE